MQGSSLNPTIQSIETMRSVRDFKSGPIEEEKLRTVLEAATRAPSSGNSQPWAFVVVRDHATKSRVGEVIARAWHTSMDSYMANLPPERRRVYAGATRLVEHTSDVPVVVLACLDMDRASRSEEARYASIYPAVQNMMLAAWSLGIGSCITTHATSATRGEPEVKEILGMPKHVKIAALVYLGYPSKAMAPPKRPSLSQVVHYDSW